MTATAGATDLHALEPDPLQPAPADVERYVAALKGLAADDPGPARRRAWAQLRLAGVRARTRRAEALRSLELIFRLGMPPRVDGETRGALLTPALPAPAQSLVRAASTAWMPWLGKRFDAAGRRGDNLVAAGARLPLKLLGPSYEPEPLGDGRLAVFGFDTRVAPGEQDRDRQVLKIDYDRGDNPVLLRNILDELVEVVPGAYLGKMLVRRRRGGPYGLTAWFALEQPG